MVKLRKEQVIAWKEEMKRKVGQPSRYPDLTFVGRYKCYWCDRIFYYKHGDPETPQYNATEDGTRPFCHACWHQLKLSSPLYRSGCWLCQLQQAVEEWRRRNLRDQRRKQEASEDFRTNYTSTQSLPAGSQPSRNGSSSSLPDGRRRAKNKKKRRVG